MGAREWPVRCRHGRLDAVFVNAGMSAGRGFAASDAGRIDALDMAVWTPGSFITGAAIPIDGGRMAG